MEVVKQWVFVGQVWLVSGWELECHAHWFVLDGVGDEWVEVAWQMGCEEVVWGNLDWVELTMGQCE